jgi:hypothetical protein
MAPARRLVIVLSAAILLLILFRATIVSSQTVDQLQPGFSQALLAVRAAEAAGATPSEIAPLVGLLNNALQLNEQAAASSQNRTQLQAQVSNQLATVQSRAGQLESMASQRMFTDKLVSYLAGGVGAIIATIACAYLFSFWRRYRVKRTFQMKVYKK